MEGVNVTTVEILNGNAVEQIVMFGVAETVKSSGSVMVTLADAVQPLASVTVTV